MYNVIRINMENFESNLQADEINQNFLFELNKNKIE